MQVVQEITNEKAPDAPEEVKTGDNTMLIIPVIIGILAVIGIRGISVSKTGIK